MNLEDVKYWAVVSNQGIHPSVSMSKKEFDWLVEQAETLQKIADRWVEIETNGTYEEANDFYTFVQDTLSSNQLD